MSSPEPASPPPHVHVSLRAAAREAVEAAWADAVRSGALPPVPVDADVPIVEVSHTSDPAHGDVASSLALKLARPLRRPPMAIAEAIAAHLRDGTGTSGPLADVKVAAPGFLNMRLAPAYLERALDAARAAGDEYGRLRQETPRKIDVEFVSANPTGPLTVGNARGAFVGDLLCRVLEAAGDDVTREYYFNDSGRQVRVLGASVAARKVGDELPEEAYRGAYVDTLALEIPDATWVAANATGADRDAVVGAWASERIRAGIEASLAHLGVHFDVWTSEASLHAEGWVERAVERLRTGGYVFEQDGATWFRSTDLRG